MTKATLLDQIRESNGSYLAGTPKWMDSDGAPFLVIACIDSRLTGFMEPAMGLPKNRALLIRIGGNRVTRSSHDVLRSVANAVYMKGANEVVILGHTDCALANFSSSRVIESFRAAGIPRSAFGDTDLREWFGAFSDPQSNVIEGIESLRNSGLLPSSLRIHGAIIDTSSGKLTVLHDGDTGVTTAVAREPAEKPDRRELGSPEKIADISVALQSVASEKQRVPSPAPRLGKGPIVISATQPSVQIRSSAGDSVTEAIAVLAQFFSAARENPKLRNDFVTVRNLVRSEKNPMVILSALERILREHASQDPRAPAALECLARHLDSKYITEARLQELLRVVLGNS